jgi:phage terminase small subunit
LKKVHKSGIIVIYYWRWLICPNIKSGLSEKQKKFADEYIKCLNASEAYRKAGYKSDNVNTVKNNSSKLLANAYIQEYISQIQKKLQEKTEITQEWVLNRLKEISDRCMQEVPVMKRVDGEMVETGEFKFDSQGAVKSTELLGKHLGLFEAKQQLQQQPVINISLKGVSNGKTD